ncbi:MAG: acyl carrier protein [Candidatus Aminicenantes bacterium]|jgi:acyl carrier protein
MKNNYKIDANHIRRDLLSYIKRVYGKTSPEDISIDSPLLQLGIIDSLSLMSLILYIEQKYHLDFYTIDVSRDHFTDIKTISKLICENIHMNHQVYHEN